MYCKTILFLVNDATLASDNPSRFRKNLLERTLKRILTTDNKIKDEKLQYDINREAAKILAVSHENIDQYRYLSGEQILLSNEKQIIQQV